MILWTEEEVNKLKELKSKSLDNKEIGNILGKSASAIQMKGQRLGLNQFNQFTTEELDKLKELYPTTSYNEMSKIFNKSKPAILYQVKRLGLRKRVHHTRDLTVDFLKKEILKSKRLCDIGRELEIPLGALVEFCKKNNFNIHDYYTPEMEVRHKIKENSGFLKVLNRYKGNAKARNIKFELTKDQFKELTSGNCYYCNVEPKRISKSKSGLSDYKYNGIDKKTPSKGYVYNNSVSCCWECNKFKSDYTLNEFYELIVKIKESLDEK